MRGPSFIRYVALGLLLALLVEAGSARRVFAADAHKQPTVRELLERIEALEKALEEVKRDAAARAAECAGAAPAVCAPSAAGAAPQTGVVEAPTGQTKGVVAVRREAPAAAPAEAAVAAAVPASTDAKLTAGYKNGFFLASPAHDYELRLRGYMQTDGRFFVDDGGGTDEFTIRRARLDLRGTLADRFSFELSPDFAGSKLTLFDAYADAVFAPWLVLRAGKFKTPFGIERLQGATNLPVIERGLPDNLIPNRDIGVRVAGNVRGETLQYDLALLNGVPDGASGDGDVNDAFDLATRVFVRPYAEKMYSPFRGAGMGLAGTWGREQGSSSSSQLPSFKTTGRQTFFSYDGAIADGDHYRVSPQASWYEGPFSLLTEYVLSSQQVSEANSRAWVANDAWQLRTTWLLTGEKATPDYVVPDAPFDFGGGHWGAWQLAFRWGSLDVDPKAFRRGYADPAEAARHADALGAAVDWYLNRNVAIFIHYEHTMFGGGDGSGDREDENVFVTRMQLLF